MKKFYKVVSRYYDSGFVSAEIVGTESHETVPETKHREGVTCDIYVDYFGTKRKANEAIRQMLNGKENYKEVFTGVHNFETVY